MTWTLKPGILREIFCTPGIQALGPVSFLLPTSSLCPQLPPKTQPNPPLTSAWRVCMTEDLSAHAFSWKGIEDPLETKAVSFTVLKMHLYPLQSPWQHSLTRGRCPGNRLPGNRTKDGQGLTRGNPPSLVFLRRRQREGKPGGVRRPSKPEVLASVFHYVKRQRQVVIRTSPGLALAALSGEG